ncbi:golgin subfamily A member 4-like [Danaus plexippus]|uniref:golgin subfamily A member 4-like n=1 Tax=Danaus plexippus TaxID=13037 RepID=UPI002AAF1F12|nr:golgin subfamily A member 4-like [Danaus plexippus]
MFSKAKRFDVAAPVKSQSKIQNKKEPEKNCTKVLPKIKIPTSSNENLETQSQCGSVHSSKSFKTPRPVKTVPPTKATSSLKKPLSLPKCNLKKDMNIRDDLLKSHEVEIRNKDYTIKEHNKQIEELKSEIAKLQKMLKTVNGSEIEKLHNNFSKIDLKDKADTENDREKDGSTVTINNLKHQISVLEKECEKLEQEVSSKQVELSSLEEIITIRDSLCTDLQKKLTDVESCLDETRHRLEMVKGHHALALEANESIRREYKVELETLKTKLEEEKQSIINKSKVEQENLKQKYSDVIEAIKYQIATKDERIHELESDIIKKEQEMKAKLEQVDEATREKLRLCEIQYEERTRHLQEHLAHQQAEMKRLENEIKELRYAITVGEEKNKSLQRDILSIQNEKDAGDAEKKNLQQELEDLKEEKKKKQTHHENEIKRLTVEADKAVKDKNKFEMSLSVTRDIVQVLTMRLRESDKELEHLENQVQSLTNSKELLESEVETFKNTLNNTVLECNEYKEALVNILKSKAALAKEHNRIMEHNVSLIESLQNVEKEAYRELGSIKSELIEDVELLKKESNSQIQQLKDEVENKRVLCELATEQAGQAAAAAERSRGLLARAAHEIERLEDENARLQRQIQDQQSLVVELSLLRQENEELTLSLAKQSSIIDKMKKESAAPGQPRSPSVMRKTLKLGKENLQAAVSPLRERNH